MGVNSDDSSATASSPAATAAEEAKAHYQEKAAPTGPAMDMSSIMEKAGSDAELTMMEDKKGDDDLATEGAPDDSLVIKMCNTIISDAVTKKASAIHFEPFEQEL